MDIPTLLIVLATVLSLTSIALAMTWRLNHEEPGLPQWTMGHVTISIGILLMSAQSQWHPLLSIVLANMLIASGYGLSVAGTRAFFGRDPSTMWRLVPVIALMGGGLTYFSLVAPSLPARIVLGSSVYAGLCLLAVAEFHRHGGMATMTSRYMMLVFSVFAAAMVMRIAVNVLFPSGNDLFTGGPMEQMTFYNGIVQAILIALGYIILTTERLQQELRAQAALDPLTGIFNRRAFFEAAAGRVAEAVRARQPVSVLAVDLDHFKRINDGYGHSVGDRVLRHFVRTARRELREQDTMARFGGEEFVALLPPGRRERGGERRRTAGATVRGNPAAGGRPARRSDGERRRRGARRRRRAARRAAQAGGRRAVPGEVPGPQSGAARGGPDRDRRRAGSRRLTRRADRRPVSPAGTGSCRVEQLGQQRVGKSPFYGHAVEGLRQVRQGLDLHQRAALQLVAHDDGRQHRQTDPLAREQPHHRHVVHLGDELRA